MLLTIEKVLIRNSQDMFEYINLDNIMEGVDGSATFGYSVEPSVAKVEDGQSQNFRWNHTFDIRVFDESTETDQMKSWINAQTEVDIVAYSATGFLYMQQVQLTINKQFDEVIALAVLATKTTPVGYYGGNSFLQSNNRNIYGLFDDHQVQMVYAGRDLLGITTDISRPITIGGKVWHPNVQNDSAHYDSSVDGDVWKLTKLTTNTGYVRGIALPLNNIRGTRWNAKIEVTKLTGSGTGGGSDPYFGIIFWTLKSGGVASGFARGLPITAVGQYDFNFHENIPAVNSEELMAAAMFVRSYADTGSELWVKNLSIELIGSGGLDLANITTEEVGQP